MEPYVEDELSAMPTRIIFCNDTLENWSKSTKLLYRGEIALGRLDGELSDSFEIRVGTGDKTWNEIGQANVRAAGSSAAPSEDLSQVKNDLTSL